MTSAPPIRRAQGGAFLLEALIAILIFSLGVLGIVGLQARSLKVVGDAQYRGEAAYLAQTLAGRMWVHDPKDVDTYFASAGAGFTSWKTQVTDAATGLPGAATIEPEITFEALNSAGGRMATITIYWQVPGEEKECGGDTTDKACYHKYLTSIVVGANQS